MNSNEGYRGNDTVRGLRKFDSIYHAVFACVRGVGGYPDGQLPYQTIGDGLLLRPAIPVSGIFGESSTYGPRANFKIALRELPDHGNFRVTVTAARYDDGLLLGPNAATRSTGATTVSIANPADVPNPTVKIQRDGIYQVDVYFEPAGKDDKLHLRLGERHFAGQLFHTKEGVSAASFMLVRLKAGPLQLNADYADGNRIRFVVFSRLDENDKQAQRFISFERRKPELGVQVGLRRDCGHTMAAVGQPQPVSSKAVQEYAFEGAINNFPSPDVQPINDNYLAGVREISVRSEYTDGRDMPRLLVKSIEFEGPLYEAWPPLSHRRILIDSEHPKDSPEYAAEVLRNFATRAFRRPVSDAELDTFLAIWKDSIDRCGDFNQSLKDALLVVLTSPQFLFLVEQSAGPEAEDLDEFELASKLSYFLWNTAPDERLLSLAEDSRLHISLDDEVQRLIRDERFSQFTRTFTRQWLNLQKFDVVDIDRNRYPKLTRAVKSQLREEPIQLLQYLICENLPLRELIQSEFVMANDAVATYYGIGNKAETGSKFSPVRHESSHLGGVLSQACILAGLSDGRESNPIKRGAWLARKIIAEPPDDPPPNVPELTNDDDSLSLRQKLERHRNQKGCVNCHAGIDPWGLPFETFDAAGIFKANQDVDADSTLPDGAEIKGLNELKDYLAKDRIDRVAFSFMKHLASYATGRTLNYQEVVLIEEEGLKLKSNNYRMQDMIRFVVTSEIFLKK